MNRFKLFRNGATPLVGVEYWRNGFPFAYGVSFGRYAMRPSAERFTNGDWYVQVFGVSLWHHDCTPQTVGERGVW